MGLLLCEFEIYRDRGGMFRSVPFGLSGEISGRNYRDVCEKTAEWLKAEAETLIAAGDELPELPLGNFSKAGGRILLVAVEPSPTITFPTINTNGAVPSVVSASQAAEMLGVSRSRISQMTRSGALDGYRQGRDAFVTIDSINARLAAPKHRGRPKTDKPATD